jgi:hypothetical protein
MKNIKLTLIPILAVILLPFVGKAQMCGALSDPPPVLTISGPTTDLCAGTTYNYTTSLTPGFTADSYSWGGPPGLPWPSPAYGPGLPPTVTSIPFSGTAGTYNLTIHAVGPNLISNGNFVWNPGDGVYPCFTTQYQNYAGPSGNTDGHIKLGSWIGSAAPCLSTLPPGSDVYTHSGIGYAGGPERMLNVRGATCFGHRSWHGLPPEDGSYGWWENDHCAEGAPGYFWGENVNLTSGQEYRFEYWVRLMGPCDPVQLPKITVALANTANPQTGARTNFSFSPIIISSEIIGSSGTCGGWQHIMYGFVPAWLSLPTGTYFICMYDENHSDGGNDFSIDDIALRRVSVVTKSITLTPKTHTEDIIVNPNDADPSIGIDGFPCAGTNPFTITCTPGATVTYVIDGGAPTTVTVPSGTYPVPFTASAGTTHTIKLTNITVAPCSFPVSIVKTVQFIDKPIGGYITYPQDICEGDDFTLDAYASFAEPGKYLTSYSWFSPSFSSPFDVPISTSGNSATFHANASGMITVNCTITNRCGSITVPVTFYVKPQPVVSVTNVTPCAPGPICPGNPIMLNISGTTGATLTYYYSWPTSSGTIPYGPITVTLPISSPTTFTPPSPALLPPGVTLAEGTFSIWGTVMSVDGCQNNFGPIKVDVRSPKCDHMVLDGPLDPCHGDDYKIRIYGDPGVYTVFGPYGPAFTVTLPDPITGTSYALSPIYHMPDLPDGPGMVSGMHTFVVDNIVGCGGCTTVSVEGSYIPCTLTVYARPTPHISGFYTTPACTGYPITLSVLCSWVNEPWSKLEWLPGTEFAGVPPTLFSPPVLGGYPASPLTYTQNVTPLTTGPHTYYAKVTSLNGCTYMASRTVNVTDPPAPIVGPTNICIGETALFTDPDPGGTWSVSAGYGWLHTSMTPAGIATGLAAGTSTINYVLPTGCATSTTLIVDPTPGPIGGDLTICGVAGTTSALSNSLGGGTWTSMNPSVATISPTGVVTAHASGTAEISYSTVYGCDVSAIITADVHPPIVGSTILCGAGDVSTLSITEPGGTWSSSNTDVAIVEALTGEVIGIGFGSATITYHRPAGLCDAYVDVYVVADDGACVEIITVGSGPSAVNIFRFSSFYPGTTVKFSMVNDPVGCFSSVGLAAPNPIETAPGSGIYDMGPLPANTGYWAPYYRDIYETYGWCSLVSINMISFEVANPSGPSCTKISTCSASLDGLKPGRQSTDKIKNGPLAASLSVMPNPNNGAFTLTGELATTKDVEIEVTDILGKTIYSNTAMVEKGRLRTKVIMDNKTANGVYLVRVKNTEINEVVRFTLNR